MDFNFESVTQVFNKVKNAVMNYTEYEIKVRDATNNDPWGASSTLMNEIASATWHFNHFTEIMTTIYKRLEESSSSEWRKVYKALQLLEFLLKNGSDNVLDSVKTHSRDISVLDNFHYIDEKGKDQGINIRHRAKEILELVKSPTKLEEERVKAKANKSKYTGVSSSGVSFSGSSSFSQPSFHQQQNTQRASFQEKKQVVKKEAPPPPVQELDLLNFDDAPKKANDSSTEDWGDFTTASNPVVASSPPKSSSTNVVEFDQHDDFGDFSDFKMAPPNNPPVSSKPVISHVENNSDFADFKNVLPQKDTEEKDPFSKLVNLDSLGSFIVKDAGPSLADLQKNKN